VAITDPRDPGRTAHGGSIACALGVRGLQRRTESNRACAPIFAGRCWRRWKRSRARHEVAPRPGVSFPNPTRTPGQACGCCSASYGAAFLWFSAPDAASWRWIAVRRWGGVRACLGHLEKNLAVAQAPVSPVPFLFTGHAGGGGRARSVRRWELGGSVRAVFGWLFAGGWNWRSSIRIFPNRGIFPGVPRLSKIRPRSRAAKPFLRTVPPQRDMRLWPVLAGGVLCGRRGAG